jgi:hypothetical protein
MANYNEYNQKNEIAGLTVDYYSDSAPGMYTDKGYIHHNLLYDRGNKVSDRHMGIRAMQANETGYSEVAYNSLRRFRHRGINSGLFVHDNELYSDSFATNSFALNAGDNATVINNKVFGMGDNPIGIGWGSDLRVADNFVYIWCYSPTQRFDEYEVRSSSVAGMRFTHLTAQNYANMLFLKAITLC